MVRRDRGSGCSSGFTVVDMTVAITVLAVGILGLAAMVGVVGKQMRSSLLDTRIAMLAAREMEGLLSADRDALGSGTRQQGDMRIVWQTRGSWPRELELIVTYDDGMLQRADTLVTLVQAVGP